MPWRKEQGEMIRKEERRVSDEEFYDSGTPGAGIREPLVTRSLLRTDADMSGERG